MTDIKWVKLTTQMFDDEKIRIIEAMPEADTLLVIWIRLICIAGKCNNGGQIYLNPGIPYSTEHLATIFNRPLNTVRLALETFLRLKMIERLSDDTLFMPNFGKYQSMAGLEEIREQTRLRVARYRQRQKLLPPVTDGNVTSNGQIRSEQILLDKKRIEIDNYVNSEENEIWQRVLEKLAGQVNKSNFNTWLKNTIGLSRRNGYFTVGVPNVYTAEHLDRNCRSLLESVLAEQLKEDIKVRFEVVQKNNAEGDT